MKKTLIIALLGLIAMFSPSSLKAQTATKSGKKILFVVTSTSRKGNTGKKTGYFLSEVSHPWKVLNDAGYTIDFVSPQGGQPPVDAFDLTDPVNKEFWDNKTYNSKINNSMKPSEVDPSQDVAIFYAGGHGTMWDLPDNTDIASIGC